MWAWTRVDGRWHTLLTERGGWQGSPDSNLVFCLDLEQAFEDAGLDAGAVTRIGYADDTFLDGTPADLRLISRTKQLNKAMCRTGFDVS